MDLKGKRILVTGADGFIGSHLAEMLVREGSRVRALAQYNSNGSWGWLDGSAYAGDLEIVLGDVRDPHQCQEVTRGIDVVLNLAALIAIPYSYVAPDSYIDTNVKGALNLCQGALANGAARFVQVSTSEVYGTARYVPIDEEHPMQPQSPYSASKIGSDAIAMSFRHAFGLPVVVARPFNTYGPRQSTRAVLPTVISQIAQGSKEIRLGALSPTRDFNFVEDTCHGLALLAACDAAVGRTVNVGSNSEISIGEAVDLIQRIMGTNLPVVSEEARLRPKDSEVERLWCDNSLIRSLCGYEPAVPLEEGLRRTVAWFLEPSNLARYKGGRYHV